ncbi:hypothetical protein [Paenimyroides baculatum]|uniref:Uncharacterized protein n=1 Tax=Paenimyroides baculatum TaxID=2608000 RepID=A0A5M6CGK4_9FLAO|nr:hypothetical protein [Paenimyroides baculatum]KAA5534301.1 hypothetical protein F0460_09340 [Paenimyroides baculatum]
MAVNKDTEYKGEYAEEILIDIFMQGDTLSKGLVKSLENVGTDSYYIRKSSAEDGLMDYICDFEPTNDITLDEVRVDLKKLTFQLEACKEDLRRNSAGKMNGKQSFEAPQDEVDAIMLDLNNKLGFKFEKLLWTGNKTVTGEFDGFLTGLTPTDEVDLSTPTDVVSALELAIDSTKEEILQAPDFKLVVSSDVLRKYNRALDQRGYMQEDSYFDGYKIETANGLPKGTILTYNHGNLNVVSDLTSNITNITVADFTDKLVHKIGLRSDFKVTTAIVDKTDVVYIKAQMSE